MSVINRFVPLLQAVLPIPFFDGEFCINEADICLVKAKENTKSPQELFAELFKNNKYVFVGEIHPVGDEAILIDLISTFKALGVENIALEIPANFNEAVQAYLRGDESLARDLFFTDDVNRRINLLKGLKAKDARYPQMGTFIKKAHEAGLKIICIDSTPDASCEARESRMVKELLSLQGKTLVLLGSFHVTKDLPCVSAVETMGQLKSLSSGFTAANVVLESAAGREHVLGFANQRAQNFFHLYKRWQQQFGDPRTSLAIYARQLGDMTTYQLGKRSNAKYFDIVDAVILLSPEKSPFTPNL